MQYVLIVFILVTTLVTGGLAGRKGFEKATDRNIGISKVSSDEYQTADLNKIQKDDRQGQLQVAGAIAEVAMSAQSIAAPGVSPNPLKIGFSDGMTIGSYIAGAADRASSSSDTLAGAQDAPSSAPAGDAGAPAMLGDNGVDVANAPDDYYVAWYAVRNDERYLMVTTVERFRQPGTMANVFSEYGNETPVKKVALTKASWSRNEVNFLIGNNVTSWDRGSTNYGTLGGVTYNFAMSADIPNQYDD